MWWSVLARFEYQGGEGALPRDGQPDGATRRGACGKGVVGPVPLARLAMRGGGCGLWAVPVLPLRRRWGVPQRQVQRQMPAAFGERGRRRAAQRGGVGTWRASRPLDLRVRRELRAGRAQVVVRTRRCRARNPASRRRRGACSFSIGAGRAAAACPHGTRPPLPPRRAGSGGCASHPPDPAPSGSAAGDQPPPAALPRGAAGHGRLLPTGRAPVPDSSRPGPTASHPSHRGFAIHPVGPPERGEGCHPGW